MALIPVDFNTTLWTATFPIEVRFSECRICDSSTCPLLPKEPSLHMIFKFAATDMCLVPAV